MVREEVYLFIDTIYDSILASQPEASPGENCNRSRAGRLRFIDVGISGISGRLPSGEGLRGEKIVADRRLAWRSRREKGIDKQSAAQ
jgi:hypothetical protein